MTRPPAVFGTTIQLTIEFTIIKKIKIHNPPYGQSKLVMSYFRSMHCFFTLYIFILYRYIGMLDTLCRFGGMIIIRQDSNKCLMNQKAE